MVHVHHPPPDLAEPDPVRAALVDPVVLRSLAVGGRVLLRRWMPHSHRTELESAAEDLVSEAQVTALENAAGFDPSRGAAVTTWIHGILKNLARKRFTRIRRGPDAEGLANVADPGPAVQDQLIRESDREQVRLALAKLDPLDRRIAHLTYYESMPNAVTAAEVGLTPVGLRVRLYRIRKELFQLLSPTFPGGRS